MIQANQRHLQDTPLVNLYVCRSPHSNEQSEVYHMSETALPVLYKTLDFGKPLYGSACFLGLAEGSLCLCKFDCQAPIQFDQAKAQRSCFQVFCRMDGKAMVRSRLHRC